MSDQRDDAENQNTVPQSRLIETLGSHALAKLLLSLPDLPVATHANNHTFAEVSDGKVSVGLLRHYSGQHIVIGNISKRNLNKPNWYITEMYLGDAPEEWPRYYPNEHEITGVRPLRTETLRPVTETYDLFSTQ